MTASRRPGHRVAAARGSLLRILVAVPFLFVLAAGVAWAYWVTSGAGTGSATTGSVNAPETVTASNTADTTLVSVNWTAPAPAGSLVPSGYYVNRVRTSDGAAFPACGSSPASPITATTCNDTNVPDGTYRYQVTAVKASWTATSAFSVTVTVLRDTIAPTVTIDQAATQADPTTSATIAFIATFSEPVTGFTADDVTVGGTATGTKTVSITGSGPVYTVIVTGVTGNGTVTATIAAGTVTNLAGNANTASTSTDNTVTRDVTPPTVTINQSATQADPTNSGTVMFTATFSEPVTGFTADDVTVGGTATGTKIVTISGTGPTYTVTIAGATSNGTVTATIAAGTVTDAAGNPNTASTSTDNTVTRDVTPPTVTINQAATQADPTSSGTVVFTVTFSERVTGFTADDVTLGGTAGGTMTVSLSGTGPVYTVMVAGVTGNGTVTAFIAAGSATDLAGNANTASTSTDNTVTRDGTVPTVTINQTATQVDPTNSATVAFIATFSEPVTGFTAGDVTVGGTATGTKTVTLFGTGPTYTVTISGATSNGTVTATIAAGTVTDAAGNPNTASTSTDNTVTINRAWVKAQVRNDDALVNDNWIKLTLGVVNTGTSPVDLSTLTMRYWFSRDAGAPATTVNCWYAFVGCSNVGRSVVPISARTGADAYLQLTFQPRALAANGGSSGEIMLGINKVDWSTFNEENDHSWSPAAATLAASDRVTIYQNGTLIWGTEPR